MFSSPLTLIKYRKEVRKSQIFLEQKILCLHVMRDNGLEMAQVCHCWSIRVNLVYVWAVQVKFSLDSSSIKNEVYSSY